MITVPPLVPSSGAYVVPNRSTGPCAAGVDSDGAAEVAGWLSAGAVDGTGVVVLVPPQAATSMAAPANRPTSFRIKAPPSCVGSWMDCSLAVRWPQFPAVAGSDRRRMGSDALTRIQRLPSGLRSGEDRLPPDGCQIIDWWRRAVSRSRRLSGV